MKIGRNLASHPGETGGRRIGELVPAEQGKRTDIKTTSPNSGEVKIPRGSNVQTSDLEIPREQGKRTDKQLVQTPDKLEIPKQLAKSMPKSGVEIPKQRLSDFRKRARSGGRRWKEEGKTSGRLITAFTGQAVILAARGFRWIGSIRGTGIEDPV